MYSVQPQMRRACPTLLRVLYEFQRGKNAATARQSICSILGEGVVAYDARAFWLKWFKSDDFGVIDGHATSTICAQLLAEHSAQTQNELAEQSTRQTSPRGLLPMSVDLLEWRIRKNAPVYGQRRTSSEIVARQHIASGTKDAVMSLGWDEHPTYSSDVRVPHNPAGHTLSDMRFQSVDEIRKSEVGTLFRK